MISNVCIYMNIYLNIHLRMKLLELLELEAGRLPRPHVYMNFTYVNILTHVCMYTHVSIHLHMYVHTYNI